MNFGVAVADNDKNIKRLNLLADVAEMYFIEGKNQAQIAGEIGVTRSNISRMLTEARIAGVITFNINRPLKENHALAQKLIRRFNLLTARVVCVERPSQLLSKLGQAAGEELLSHLKSGAVLGTSWGTAISATVEQIDDTTSKSDIKVVQLLGALGARIKDYDGHSIVRRLENKLNAEGFYLNAPLLVDNKEVVKSLFENKNIHEPLNLGKHADIALLGVGSSELKHSSYYLADYITKEQILAIQKTGAVGDVCAKFFTIDGEISNQIFDEHLIGISLKDFKQIPIRMGVAGGPAKIKPIIGALRSGLINILISDELTISEVIDETE